MSKNYMACNGPTLDWTEPTKTLMNPRMAHKVFYWLLIVPGEAVTGL